MTDAQTPTPAWRHPGFLLIYAIGAVALSMVGAVAVAQFGRHAGGAFSVLIASLVAAIFCAVFAVFRRFVEGQPVRELALRPALPELAAGIVIGLVLFSIIVAVIAALGGYRVIGYRSADVLVPALAVAILSGFTEEIVFRGYLFRLVEQWLGSWVALALSAALFGALHLGNPHASPVAAVAIALEAGIMLAAIYMVTRRLWAVIGVHAAWNFAQGGIYGIPVSGTTLDGVLRPDIRGSELLTGGAFGAEASLPAIIVATAFGIAVLVVARRRGDILPPLWVRKRKPPKVDPEELKTTFG